nr:hypothetical protein [uncultured Porphyromonas sp.]
MSNNHYNYSISLIRRANDRWVIDPEDTSAQAFHYELLGKSIGDVYLATKTEAELSYSIFLSGDVCHSDIYGWIITLNGWQILDLDTYLHLSREVWKRFAQASLSGHEIRLLLHELMESTGLVLSSSPAPIDRNVEHHYQSLNFAPKKKPRVVPKTTEKDSNDGHIWATLVLVFIFVGSACFLIAQVFSRSSSTGSEPTAPLSTEGIEEVLREQAGDTAPSTGDDNEGGEKSYIYHPSHSPRSQDDHPDYVRQQSGYTPDDDTYSDPSDDDDILDGDY